MSVRITINAIGVCAMSRLAVPLMIIENRTTHATPTTPATLKA